MGSMSTEQLDKLQWKARLVAGGNHLVDKHGSHQREFGLTGSPASLEAVRIAVWWSTMAPHHVLLQSDVHGAYLQALIGGKPVFCILPKDFWPPSWHKAGLKVPVVRLHRALYGLQRSGFDWMKHADEVLRHHGWLPVVDVVDSVYYKVTTCNSFMIIALYVDDLLVSGPESAVYEAMAQLRRIVPESKNK